MSHHCRQLRQPPGRLPGETTAVPVGLGHASPSTVVRSAASAVLLLVLFPTVGRAQPITFQAPLPLEEGQVAVASQGFLIEAPDGPSPENADERTMSLAAIAMTAL